MQGGRRHAKRSPRPTGRTEACKALSATDIFLFQGFHLDRRGLFREEEDSALAPVEIGSRALDVLRVLAERPGDLLPRHEIMAAAWPGMLVDDNNLTIQISTLRRVLDDGRTKGSGCMLTVPGRGYCLMAPVTRAEPADRPMRPAPRLFDSCVTVQQPQ